MSLQNLATQMAAQGRGPDHTLVHMSPKELQGLQALAMAHGGSLTINPETGLPEAGFLDNILPAIAGFALDAFLPGAGEAVGGMFGLEGAAANQLGSALTVGGISGLASGSLEKGIMAGMGAYGGAGLASSFQNAGTTALTKAGIDAAGGAEGLGGDASSVQDAVAKASAFDKIKAGAGSAFSAPKDFLQNNKMNLAMLTAPVLMDTFGNKPGIPAAQETKKYNMNYVKDPVTGALYDTSGEGVTYGGVGRSTRGMADGGIIDDLVMNTVPASDRANMIATETNAPNTQQVAYDTRTDSQKALDYLMGKPGSTNPMLFTHEQATSPIQPADFATRTGGHYVLNAATNTYTWIPDAVTAGLDALKNQTRGSDGRDINPKDQDRINAFMDAETAKDKALQTQENAEYGDKYAPVPDKFTQGQRIQKDFDFLRALDPKNSFIFQGLNALFGKQNPNLVTVEDRTPVPVNAPPLDEGVNTSTVVAGGDGNYGGYSGDFGGRDAGGGSGGGSEGRDSSHGDSSGYSGGAAKGGFYKNGKFNFHPAQVYANGGIAALAGGGLGSLGGYSDGGQLLKGPGDGVSDSIPARIAGNQPARLADGEFVIPARIVSELGNGSTNAGAKQLYKMLDRIQSNRAKTVGKNKTAVNSKSARYLPA